MSIDSSLNLPGIIHGSDNVTDTGKLVNTQRTREVASRNYNTTIMITFEFIHYYLYYNHDCFKFFYE